MPKWTKIGPGCGLDNNRKGRYVVRYYRKGRRTSDTLDTSDYASAVTRAKALYDRWQRGEYDPWTDRDQLATVGDACDHYQRERGTELRDKGQGNVWLLKAVCRRANVTYIQGLGPAVLRRAVYDYGIAEATQYSNYRKLAAILNWMTRAGYFRSCPMEQVAKPSKPKRHPKYFKARDLESFLITLPEVYKMQKYAKNFRYPLWYADALKFYLYSGVRRSEGPRVCWGDVHNEHIVIRDTKKKKDRIVYILPKMRELLDDLERNTRLSDDPSEPILKACDGVSPISGRYLSKKFNQVRDLAMIPPIGLHGLRHTFAMLMVQAGVPTQAIQKMLGHDDLSTTQVYTNMMPGDVIEAVKRAFG